MPKEYLQLALAALLFIGGIAVIRWFVISGLPRLRSFSGGWIARPAIGLVAAWAVLVLAYEVLSDGRLSSRGVLEVWLIVPPLTAGILAIIALWAMPRRR